MNTYWWALIIFMTGYLINIFYVTVLYHRGLTHESVILHPWVKKWTEWTGIWVTGIDPKAWACMHRMHHMYSDTKRDPHSPQVYGVFGVALEQLHSYERALRDLIKRKKEVTNIVSDISFDVSFLNRKKLWILPYVLHGVIAMLIAVFAGAWLLGVAYYVGIVSHPIQGWMVNALAHKYGYRNFTTDDHSTNNWLVSLLVFGEGYQNNHHARPKRANFAIRASEIDLGYLLCLLASQVKILKIRSV